MESSRGPCSAALVRPRLAGAHAQIGGLGSGRWLRWRVRRDARSVVLHDCSRPRRGIDVGNRHPYSKSNDVGGAGWHEDEGKRVVHVHRGAHQHWAKLGGARLRSAASSLGVSVGGANYSTGGGGGGGGARGAGAGTTASACTMGVLGPATS